METSFLRRLQETVESHQGDSRFGVEALAVEMGMSPRQLRRKLRSLTGETPKALLLRFRLTRAASLLQQNTGDIRQIAFASGFGSISRFQVNFRESFGVTPTEYARSEPGNLPAFAEGREPDGRKRGTCGRKQNAAAENEHHLSADLQSQSIG